jgi:hypothetical protein
VGSFITIAKHSTYGFEYINGLNLHKQKAWNLGEGKKISDLNEAGNGVIKQQKSSVRLSNRTTIFTFCWPTIF